MRNLFRLKYKMGKESEKAIELNKETNIFTGEDLKKLGFYVEPYNMKVNYFTITKYEEPDGFLTWKIQNNFEKDFYINSKSNPSGLNHRIIKKNEMLKLKNLTDEIIYFNKNNFNWDHLFFDKIKVNNIEEEVNQRREVGQVKGGNLNNNLNNFRNYQVPSSNCNALSQCVNNTKIPLNTQNKLNDMENKKEDEPVDLEAADFEFLAQLNEQIDCEVVEKNETPPYQIKKTFIRVIDEEEEKQRNDIFTDENLQRILMENLTDEEDEKSVNFIPNKEIVTKKKIILDEDEEGEIVTKSKSNALLNSNLTSMSNKSDSDYLINSDLNLILNKYREDIQRNNLTCLSNNENISNNIRRGGDNHTHTHNSINSLKIGIDFNSLSNSNLNASQLLSTKISQKPDYIKSVSKFGGEFNSNGKRPRQISQQEQEEFNSGFKTKRLKKATDNKELKIELNTTCAICLEVIKELANLDNCTHDFCKSCILEWSTKYTNLCPLCKKDFKKIIYYEKNKKKEIKVKKKKLIVEEDLGEFLEEEDSSDECMVCGQSNDFENMLVCDHCHFNVCHTYCDGLSRIPSNDWFCRDCRGQNLLREILINGRDIEEDDEDEEYAPRVLEDEDEEDLEELMYEGFLEEEIEEIRQVRPRRSHNRRNNINNGNSNIQVNIHVNLNTNNRSNRGNGGHGGHGSHRNTARRGGRPQ